MDTVKMSGRKNPEESSGLLSTLFFRWTAPIFRKGARQDLQLTDLFGPLKSDESERLGDRLEREWKKELMKANQELKLGKYGNKKNPTRQPSLTWAITRLFWAPYMMQGVLSLIEFAVLHVVQSILQGWVIRYFDSGDNPMTLDQVLLYAGLLVTTNITIVFLIHHVNLRMKQTGMCVRVACSSLIYRKVLRLDQTAVNSAAAGRVANLISNDVARFDMVCTYLHHIWIMPIQVLVIGYVMWESVGTAALVGIATMTVQTILTQGYFSSLSNKLRSKIAIRTDERVQLMSELISGIQVVKMYSWEKPFEWIVSKARKLEIKVIGRTSRLRGFSQSIAKFATDITLYATLISFVLFGNELTAEITFVMTNLIRVLNLTCAVYFPQALNLAGETAASLERLTRFLLLDEIEYQQKVEPAADDALHDLHNSKTGQLIKNQVGIRMVKVAANWVHGQLPPTLCNVSFEVKSQSLCAIIGPTGSGKSSLLHLVLGELPTRAGKLSLITGKNSKTRNTSRDIRISYASQDPWLFSAPVRENILFGQPYNETRYQEVTKVCALLEDFKQLPQGDLSFVGERGVTLSGGQKARVNLARAVYRDADLYLLDDPLSAVDPRVGRHLFKECITGFLKGKTRILVTHQLQYLRNTDHVVVMNRGTVERQGTYEELASSTFHILNSVELTEVDNMEKNNNKLECKTSDLTANDSDQQITERSEQSRDIMKEETSKENIWRKVYLGYFLAGGNLCSLILCATIFILGQIAISGTNYWVMFWTNQEILGSVLHSNQTVSGNPDNCIDSKCDHREIYNDESQWFDEQGLLRQHMGIYVYTVLLFITILLVSVRSVMFMRICMNSGRNIHNSMFGNLLQAPMRFFNINPSGTILNRFAKDIGSMDERLPLAMLTTFQVLLTIIGSVTMVIVVNNWMILPAIFLGGTCCVASISYFRTARNVSQLEGIRKSPVFSHVSATLDGLITIRSRGAPVEELLRKEFNRYADAHTGVCYISIATAAAFGLFVDLITCFFFACVCFSFILMKDGNILPGSVGFGISQCLTLSVIIPTGVKYFVTTISYMTSVERLLQYTDLPKEGPFVSKNPPPPTWPPQGSIVIKNASMRYAIDEPLVLKNLNLTINPGWKVGIVGRTGAGKSSLISALFRLTGDGLEGEIILDGIDTKSIGLHELRPRISIIPQEPILFSASLRHNLDPIGQYSDAELWDSLREVELGDVVTSLDFQVAGGGANLSVGQRQLICLARAILRNNRLLVLDEATANVDHGTDALIQNTIRRRFADCTVLTIAHRLNTIMDNDRVLVMRDGRMAEFGHPHSLLKNRDGRFSKMVQQTGKAMAKKLAAIAENAYQFSPEFREKLNDDIVQETDEKITSL